MCSPAWRWPAGSEADARLCLLLVSLSLFYIGGMFLNDAFDREFDARNAA